MEAILIDMPRSIAANKCVFSLISVNKVGPSWRQNCPTWRQVGQGAQDPQDEGPPNRRLARQLTHLSPPRTPPLYLTPAVSFIKRTLSWDESHFLEHIYMY